MADVFFSVTGLLGDRRDIVIQYQYNMLGGVGEDHAKCCGNG